MITNFFKALLTLIVAAVIILPCFLIFNESDHIWLNLVGLSYICMLAYFTKKNSFKSAK